jgi:signal transduction histidine kinase
VNHPAGTLESIVARARRRNLFLAAGLLSLLIATVIALVRFTRGTEKLAEMQMSFVSGISHELRTPLSVIRAAGFNLRTKFARQPEQVERYGELIQAESEKLTALVEQILRYGSAQSGRILGTHELVAIPPLLEESMPATREALAEAGITIEEEIAADLPLIKADRQSLNHALRNLLENAVKYGKNGKPEGAVIRITAERAVLHGGPAVCIGIQDNGPGIPKEERGHVFEPFFRGKLAKENQVHGTGLGLNLAKRIIEAHKGTLVLYSEVGQGTEFVATIPAVVSE